ncbi:MAG: oligosaccharide flippase family protein [Flavobacteriaceae bacterium]
MLSVLLVNGGNYLYNLLMGRLLGPEVFADAALLITMLLVLSFVGMTFQLATAKFRVLFSGDQWTAFERTMYRGSLLVGVVIGILMVVFAPWLQKVFNSNNVLMFRIFGAAVPLYFIMSVNRGAYQGAQDFVRLSVTYQTEMWSRLILTLVFLMVLPINPIIVVSVGIAISFVFGLIPSQTNNFGRFLGKNFLTKENTAAVKHFFLITAGYELTQIIINNSDILLVKHFFGAMDAGLYASLALIGRVVYFVAWMFVMLLLPSVVQRKKDGQDTAPILFKYVTYIAMLSAAIVLGCVLFPETIITLMFGEAYISMAGLLWQYALATSLFAIANIFTYYFLSLDRYFPVILSGVLGLSQIALVALFHSSLKMVVQVQIMAMAALLLSQILYFVQHTIKTRGHMDVL